MNISWDDMLSGLGALGVGAGIAGTGFGVANAMRNQRAQEHAYDQRKELMGQPIDWQQFYKPMTDIEQQAATRALKADFQGRGIPLDGGYASDWVSDNIGAREGERVRAAQGMGLMNRQSQLSALSGPPDSGQMMSPDLSGFFRWMQGRQQPQQPQGVATQAVNQSLQDPGATAFGRWNEHAWNAGKNEGFSPSVPNLDLNIYPQSAMGNSQNPYSFGQQSRFRMGNDLWEDWQ